MAKIPVNLTQDQAEKIEELLIQSRKKLRDASSPNPQLRETYVNTAKKIDELLNEFGGATED